MDTHQRSTPLDPKTGNRELRFDLGNFEGFNFRTQSVIERLLTAQEVVAWNHDVQGEAEFWPTGDRPELALVVGRGNTVTTSELLALDRLLQELGDDSAAAFLKIHYAVNVAGADLATLTPDGIEDMNLHLFFGSNFTDLRKEAAYELFELFWPEAYEVWNSSLCDGLIFDTDRLLDSPILWVEEVSLGEQVALIVLPQ